MSSSSSANLPLPAPEFLREAKNAAINEEEKSGTSSLNDEISVESGLVEGDYGSQGGHIFEQKKIADYWRDVYENAKYEGRHRYDPTYKWTAAEEKKLLRKIDWRIMLWTFLMFCSLDLNRKNITRAITDNMLPELGMNTNDFNYGQTIFLLSFLAAELPGGLISKKVGPDRWLPIMIMSWSVVSISQVALKSKVGYYICRCLLGLCMGGFIPDTVLYLTYFYKSKELPIRLSWFWTALNICSIFGALAAAGILKMRGICGWSGWKWMFLIEGLLTFCIGVGSVALMPAGPCQTAGFFRGKKGWFTEREQYILVNRLLRDDPSKGDMHNRQAVGPVQLFKALKDFDLWPLYIIGLLAYIPPAPPATYLALIIKNMGFSTFEANLLTIPSQFLSMVFLLLISWASEWLNERSLVSSISNIWIFPFLVALITIPADASPWIRYTLLTGLLAYPYCHAILVAWNSRNSNTVRTRAVSTALYNMFVQAGNIVGNNIYRADDAPLYLRGNKILLGICVFNIVLFVAVKLYYIKRNEYRQRIWDAMTKGEQEEYIATTKDEGQRRLDFRFAH
ncbi:hypothetical protein RUND412_003478 [Rhizina undulata]